MLLNSRSSYISITHNKVVVVAATVLVIRTFLIIWMQFDLSSKGSNSAIQVQRLSHSIDSSQNLITASSLSRSSRAVIRSCNAFHSLVASCMFGLIFLTSLPICAISIPNASSLVSNSSSSPGSDKKRMARRQYAL